MGEDNRMNINRSEKNKGNIKRPVSSAGRISDTSERKSGTGSRGKTTSTGRRTYGKQIPASASSYRKTGKGSSAPKGSKAARIALWMLIGALLIVVVTAIAVAQYNKNIANNEILKGVIVNGVEIGGMTKEEASLLLKNTFQYTGENVQLTVNYKDKTKIFRMKDYALQYNVDEIVEEAYAYGRDENGALSKIANSFEPKSFKLNLTYDKEKMDTEIAGMDQETTVEVQDTQLFINESSVVLKSGWSGSYLDKETLVSDIAAAVAAGKDSVIEAKYIDVNPKEIDVQDIYNALNRAPENAYIKVENNEIVYYAEKKGIAADMGYIQERLKEIEGKDTFEITLEASMVDAEITREYMMANTLKDTISSYSTVYANNSENTRNRTINIALSAQAIEGVIIGPGETFSFNGIVGERTPERGYTSANGYIGGKIVKDVGGGVCQISSAIFNAVFYAGDQLQVTERHPHQMPVSYVESGMDAAVDYPSAQDFRFKNDSIWPIKMQTKIENEAEDGSMKKLTISIIGTDEDPGVTYDYRVDILQDDIKFKIINIEDSSMYIGETRIKQSGSNGREVATYKIKLLNGETVSEKFIWKSIYNPINQEVYIGTKPTPEPTTEAPADTPTEEPVPTPSAEPTQEPAPEPTMATPAAE